MQYETIFFDLDHTLWDFERNSQEALTELADKYKLIEKGVA
jgi:putative hydrolase of the HAD superfamily